MMRLLGCLLLFLMPSIATAQTKWQVTDANGRPLTARIGGVVVIPKAAEPPPASGDLSANNKIEATTDDMVELTAVEEDGKTPVKGNVEWVMLPLGTKYRSYQGADGSSHAIPKTPGVGSKIIVMAFGGDDKGARRLGTTEITYKVVPNGPPDVGPVVNPIPDNPPVKPVDPPPIVEVVPPYVTILKPGVTADYGPSTTKAHIESLAQAYATLATPPADDTTGWKNAGEFYGAMSSVYEKMGFTPTAPPLKATRTALREMVLSEMTPIKDQTFGMEQRRFLRKYSADVAASLRYISAHLTDPKPVDPVVPVPVNNDAMDSPYFVIVLSDQAAMTTEIAMIRKSATLRDWLDSKGIKALFIDKKNLDTFPEIAAAVAGKELPVLLVQGHQAGKLVNKPYSLPKTEKEVIDQISKHLK